MYNNFNQGSFSLKNIYIAIGVSLLVFLISLFIYIPNKAVGLEENINDAKSGIQIQEQRQHDLILQLVQVVEESTQFELSLQTQVVELRNKANSGASVDSVLTMINVVAEAYPDIKSDVAFNSLMTELSISENLKKQYREGYNDDVRKYKTFSRRQPAKLILSMVGYEFQDYNYLEFNDTNLPDDLFSQ